MISLHRLLALALVTCLAGSGMAQTKKFEANYDEANVGNVDLPPIWKGPVPADPTEAASAWPARRAELLKLFADQMFGHAPSAPAKVSWKVVEEGAAFNGAAHRQQIKVTLSTSSAERNIDLLLYTPPKPAKPLMTFLGLNFRGNHSETNDPRCYCQNLGCPIQPEMEPVMVTKRLRKVEVLRLIGCRWN